MVEYPVCIVCNIISITGLILIYLWIMYILLFERGYDIIKNHLKKCLRKNQKKKL
jgi:hypothetical protein